MMHLLEDGAKSASDTTWILLLSVICYPHAGVVLTSSS